MTAAELAAVMQGIAPALRALVDQEITERMRIVDAEVTKLRAEFAQDLTKALATVPVPRDGRDGLPGRDGAPGEKGLDGKDGKDGTDGRDGEKGLDGRDGLQGKDGHHGLGFDDFEEEYDGERTITHRYKNGDRVKEFRHMLPIALYRGVWIPGRTYTRGDRVTWAGSEWHCSDPTTSKPGEGATAWTLAVKRGRDGRDGAR